MSRVQKGLERDIGVCVNFEVTQQKFTIWATQIHCQTLTVNYRGSVRVILKKVGYVKSIFEKNI